jgi:hypothetical protein
LQYRKRERLYDAQKKLEEELRREEDVLLQNIVDERQHEVKKLSDEIKKEWEVKLKHITDAYQSTLSKSSRKMKDSDKMVRLPLLLVTLRPGSSVVEHSLPEW